MQEQIRDEISLLDYLNVIKRRKKIVITFFFISVIVTAGISLLLPKYYQSESVLIASSSEAGGLGAALSTLPFAGALAGATGIQTPADKVMVILKSRTIAEAVIQRLDLLRVFNADDWDAAKGAWKNPTKPPLMQDTVRKLSSDITTISKSKEGAITISVEWKDPKLTADIANHFVAALTGFLNDKSINITTQIVDRAIPAERKSRPRTLWNVTFAGITSIFAGVFIVFLLEGLHRKNSPQR